MDRSNATGVSVVVAALLCSWGCEQIIGADFDAKTLAQPGTGGGGTGGGTGGTSTSSDRSRLGGARLGAAEPLVTMPSSADEPVLGLRLGVHVGSHLGLVSSRSPDRAVCVMSGGV